MFDGKSNCIKMSVPIEPTSNLDSLNEAVILKALLEEKENRSVLLVSHRRSTMRIADKVHSVENGRMS